MQAGRGNVFISIGKPFTDKGLINISLFKIGLLYIERIHKTILTQYTENVGQSQKTVTFKDH
jgi:hypothetical protein